MAGDGRRGRCEFCDELFSPDPRVGARQRACRRELCQRRRKRASQAAWLAKHPDYFRGRGAQHRRYRREVSAGVRVPRPRPARTPAAPDLSPNLVDPIEQDVISAQDDSRQGVSYAFGSAAEQDAISPYLSLVQVLSAC